MRATRGLGGVGSGRARGTAAGTCGRWIDPGKGGPEERAMTTGCYEPRQARGARHKVMGNKERGNVQTAVAESSEPQGEDQAGKREGRDREGRTGRGEGEQAYREARSQPGRQDNTRRRTEARPDQHNQTNRPTSSHRAPRRRSSAFLPVVARVSRHGACLAPLSWRRRAAPRPVTPPLTANLQPRSGLAPYPRLCSRRRCRRQRRSKRRLRRPPPLVDPTWLVAPTRRAGSCAA